ncbi:bifunctional diaminohydroxyphosphoribosylaminopyrimidine deaminase/5-amino-6-(5-phosphoribosylamino)uracil reductase RibD [Mangrovimonas aestuarii]|uniref:bifunctional diaminohydroxyphosphoribosylaminopyrimidine deaminase/5-amino-6-(5-phosphoribosylamino)uracil reductase RibD n=1 Tax=Mangrovimonas aestuarii TaxID=3018443 RepID=UPI002379EFA3|nr:bifunctional diaminohydroxyphosphoribosylaminopyrimidine deaminase/5-amino-6-(5-phosphoribosylamino)uracil reductase RibD [Mangrovimonas aestuarii]
MNIHEFYIKRCIEIAKNGLGSTRPNPMVGSVIVHKDKIIGEGFTSSYGGNHAEVNAIASVKDATLLKDATIYVTLEPCSHYGKTPPCSDLIIRSGIKTVVIGCLDDNPLVAGKGVEKLKKSGCEVIVGVLELDCKEHHKRFFTLHNKKRPYVILKWAQSEDGFIAPEIRNEQKPVWITNTYSRQLVHKWRTEEHSILVGTNTVLQDNPTLTARDWTGNHLTRIVIDRKGKLSKSLNIFNNKAKTIHITEKDIDFDKPLAKQVCDILFKHQINSVIIEGGTKTLQHFINEDIWDEARIFTGKVSFHKGTLAPKFDGNLLNETKILDDTLKVYKHD